METTAREYTGQGLNGRGAAGCRGPAGNAAAGRLEPGDTWDVLSPDSLPSSKQQLSAGVQRGPNRRPQRGEMSLTDIGSFTFPWTGTTETPTQRLGMGF